jgi:aldose 1-epimerase
VRVDVAPFGILERPDRNGRREVARLSLSSSVVRVSLLTLGASLHTVEAPDRHGALAPVHLSLGQLSEYENPERNPYLGATVGRYANRIVGSCFELDGRAVHLEPNEGPHHLHGGPAGFSRQVWELAEALESADGGQVTMTLLSPDGDGGYPGKLEASVTYTLHGPTITVTYRATTDAPTVVNLASHGYWNLGGMDRWGETASISDHELRVDADAVLPAGPDAVPTGALMAVAGTAFDLRAGLAVGALLDVHPHGVDHSFALDRTSAGPRPVRPVADLHHPGSGRMLRVATDQPALHVYTANHLGPPFARQAAVCLEAQRFPDAPNRPELGSVVLRPGDRYRSTTELTFSAS